MDALIDKIRQGDRRCLAQAMSLVDSAGAEGRRLRDLVRPHTGRVPWWGFTGPPGVGKSALIDVLLSRLREQDRRVGVVAVDPTSPLSGGAFLGDRVRMMRHAGDPDVFIRSLATHGRAGGLSDATLHCARLLELASFDPVLIETVGVGQNEVDLAEVADLCTVVLAPGYGDGIQLIKAGLLEIAKLIVVNKCDLPGAEGLLSAVRHELSARASGERGTEILAVSAKSGEGVGELLDRLLALEQTARDQTRLGERQQRRLLAEIRHSAMSTYEDALRRGLADGTMRELAGRLARGEVSLGSVVTELSAAVAKLQAQKPVTPEPPPSRQKGNRG